MRHNKRDRDVWILSVFAIAASIISFAHFFLLNEILRYGDAVAHINIARRVFDSRTPGLDQLGTVWLPLPHLLTIPFIVNDWMWRTGVGGSIVSMVAYVAGVIGVFFLVRDNLRQHSRGRLAAWIAAVVYGANPNLIYVQATAMTESLSLAFFIWAIVFFSGFLRQIDAPRSAERRLWLCALMLSGEMLTRYDGWFVAIALFVVLAFFFLKRVPAQFSGHKPGTAQNGTQRANYIAILLRFGVLIAIVPAFWFVYNYKLYKNPLEFANGPYSARAIAERTSRAGDPPYPGKDHPATAALYFVKSGVLNLAGHRLEGEYGHWWRKNWQQDGWYFILLAGTIAICSLRRWPLLLLWIPLPFYALSIAYGGVPIFVPSWWPYSYYNVRYGLQLLPLAAVCMALLIAHARWSKAVTTIALVFVAITYAGTWRTDPICLREALVNSNTREQLESKLAEALAQLPTDAHILMYTGEHVGALERAGVSLKQTINENNYYAWRSALRSPAESADYAIGFNDDDVSKAVRSDSRFEAVVTIKVEEQITSTVYRKVAR